MKHLIPYVETSPIMEQSLLPDYMAMSTDIIYNKKTGNVCSVNGKIKIEQDDADKNIYQISFFGVEGRKNGNALIYNGGTKSFYVHASFPWYLYSDINSLKNSHDTSNKLDGISSSEDKYKPAKKNDKGEITAPRELIKVGKLEKIKYDSQWIYPLAWTKSELDSISSAQRETILHTINKSGKFSWGNMPPVSEVSLAGPIAIAKINSLETAKWNMGSYKNAIWKFIVEDPKGKGSSIYDVEIVPEINKQLDKNLNNKSQTIAIKKAGDNIIKESNSLFDYYISSYKDFCLNEQVVNNRKKRKYDSKYWKNKRKLKTKDISDSERKKLEAEVKWSDLVAYEVEDILEMPANLMFDGKAMERKEQNKLQTINKNDKDGEKAWYEKKKNKDTGDYSYRWRTDISRDEFNRTLRLSNNGDPKVNGEPLKYNKYQVAASRYNSNMEKYEKRAATYYGKGYVIQSASRFINTDGSGRSTEREFHQFYVLIMVAPEVSIVTDIDGNNKIELEKYKGRRGHGNRIVIGMKGKNSSHRRRRHVKDEGEFGGGRGLQQEIIHRELELLELVNANIKGEWKLPDLQSKRGYWALKTLYNNNKIDKDKFNYHLAYMNYFNPNNEYYEVNSDQYKAILKAKKKKQDAKDAKANRNLYQIIGDNIVDGAKVLYKKGSELSRQTDLLIKTGAAMVYDKASDVIEDAIERDPIASTIISTINKAGAKIADEVEDFTKSTINDYGKDISISLILEPSGFKTVRLFSPGGSKGRTDGYIKLSGKIAATIKYKSDNKSWKIPLDIIVDDAQVGYDFNLSSKIFKLKNTEKLKVQIKQIRQEAVEPTWFQTIAGQMSLTFKDTTIIFKYDTPSWVGMDDYVSKYSFENDLKKLINNALSEIDPIDLKKQFQGI
jgi:hypothetical protein